MKKNKTGLIIGLVALVAVIAIFLVIWNLNRPKPQAADQQNTVSEENAPVQEDAQDPAPTTEGSKHITIEVTGADGKTVSYELNTDADYLRQAMDEADGLTYSGTDSDFGMMVEVVNGEQAIYAVDNAYWAFYVNGEYGQYGIDSQPVNDGDKFGIVYEAAYVEAEGSKNITIEVKDSKGEVTTYEVSTDAEYLRQAMDETEGLTYSGTDSDFGMMVEVVNGEQAIYAEDNAYWAFYVNGEYGNYGIDSQPVTDGDTYSIVYEAA